MLELVRRWLGWAKSPEQEAQAWFDDEIEVMLENATLIMDKFKESLRRFEMQAAIDSANVEDKLVVKMHRELRTGLMEDMKKRTAQEILAAVQEETRRLDFKKLVIEAATAHLAKIMPNVDFAGKKMPEMLCEELCREKRK